MSREPSTTPDSTAESSGDALRDSILQQYVRRMPSPQNALDLFRGDWWSRLPGKFYPMGAGHLPLFLDPRIKWAIEAFGGVEGRSVLELGPLEGGHTYILEQAGAASVLAIEANARAFLKCLIVKEIVGMPRSHFLLGDFEDYLRGEPDRFDAAVACGILYHLREPVELILNLGRAADRVYIWTHYYDAAAIARLPEMARRFRPPQEQNRGGFAHAVHPYNYLEFLETTRFAGGSDAYSHWLTRDGLLGALCHAGFTDIQIGEDEPGHDNGPAIGLVASRAPRPRKRGLWPFR